jgi:hypothetical protein
VGSGQVTVRYETTQFLHDVLGRIPEIEGLSPYLANSVESGRKGRSFDDVTSHHRRFPRIELMDRLLPRVEGRLIEKGTSLLGRDLEALAGVPDGGSDALTQ